ADGGISGAFSDVTSNLAFLEPTLAYGSNDVVLTLMRNDVDFAAAAETANQRGVAGAVTALGSGNAFDNSVVGLDASGAQQAFDALSGEFYASRKTALLGDSRHVRRAVSDRLDHRCVDSQAQKGTSKARRDACTGTV